jgi:AcrR family transcriptional regulator
LEAERSTKERLLDSICAHVLAHGFSGASLRPLAKSADTSDRMLVYHFGSKNGLIEAVLLRLSSDLAAGLAADLPAHSGANRYETVKAIIGLLRAPKLAPYMKLWLEIAARAGHGDVVFKATATAILSGLTAWLAERLPGAGVDREDAATTALAMIEGVIVLDACGRSDLADRAIAGMERAWRTG